MSHEKRAPGCLGYIGPRGLYYPVFLGGYNKQLQGSPLNNQDDSWKVRDPGFLFVAQISLHKVGEFNYGLNYTFFFHVCDWWVVIGWLGKSDSNHFGLALPVGNEGINLYIGILGMKLPSFPTKGREMKNSFKNHPIWPLPIDDL